MRTCMMYHAAWKVEFQPFKRSYSQLKFFNLLLKIQRFLQVGPTFGGGVEPGRADGAWPGPRPAQRVIFSKSRAQARPGLWDSDPTRRRPGPASELPISLVVYPAWPVRFSEYFRCFFVLCLLPLEVSRQQRAR